MIDASYVNDLQDKETFSKVEALKSFRNGGFPLSDASFEKKFTSFLKNGEIIRVAKGVYSLPKKAVCPYKYEYSDFAKELASYLIEQYPLIDFSIAELIQLNEFANHLIGHNTIFLSVDADSEDFVFEALKNRYFGRVLCRPSLGTYDKYKCDDVIVVNKLVTESPRVRDAHWQTRLEKLLFDLVADPLLSKSISQSEYPEIYDNAFFSCPVDESSLFRYAKRRGVYEEVLKIIKEETNIILKTNR